MDWREAEREYDDEVIADTTIPVAYENAVRRHGERDAQWYKGGIYDRTLAPAALDPAPDGDYASITHDEMRVIVRGLAAGFRDLGVTADDRVGIFAETRMEWAGTDLAVLAAGGVVTTVYANSSPDQVAYLLGDPGATGVVVENEDCLERVLAVEDDLDLSFVVVMDETPYANVRDDVHSLGEVYERGRERFDAETYRKWLDARDPDDLASLIYTSGTTGKPKGVKLTHRNFRSNVNQLRRRYGPRPDKSGDDPIVDDRTRVISYLPLAHVFERTVGHFLILLGGGTVAYAESPDTLKEDFLAVEPTGGTSVPRVYERLYEAIREEASESAVKKRVFDWAIDVARETYHADAPGLALRAKSKVADALVFRQVKQAMGGDIEYLVGGGGTLSSELCALYHGMGLPIYEGYGLTETAPVVTGNPGENPKIGTIGPPLPGVDVAVDTSVVPEGTFTDTMGKVGELLVRGPNVTEGYWNMPEESDALFTDDPGPSVERDDGDPWLRTGDIVQRRPDDYLVFRERAKQILVLTTGKNVAPAPVEEAVTDRPVVEQCMLVGEDRKFVSALVVPNVDRVREELGGAGPEDRAATVGDEAVRDLVDDAIETANEDLEPHQRIKKFRIVGEEFTEDNGLLTPTLKTKRRAVLERFDDRVAEMYAGERKSVTAD